MIYYICVDGEKLGEVKLDPMPQKDRDEVRNLIAQDYHVPVHYIRLMPKFRGVK